MHEFIENFIRNLFTFVKADVLLTKVNKYLKTLFSYIIFSFSLY